MRTEIVETRLPIWSEDSARMPLAGLRLVDGTWLVLCRPLSVAPSVLRLIIDDTNIRVQSLLTFNPGDFADICRTNSVELMLL